MSQMESAQASLGKALAEFLTCNLLTSQNLHSEVMLLTRYPHSPEESPHMLNTTRSFRRENEGTRLKWLVLVTGPEKQPKSSDTKSN